MMILFHFLYSVKKQLLLIKMKKVKSEHFTT